MSNPINTYLVLKPQIEDVEDTVDAIPDEYAGIDSDGLIKNIHRPVCTYDVTLFGELLDGTWDSSVWYHIEDSGSITYDNRELTFTAPALTATNSRAVLNQTRFPIDGNFLELTCRVCNIGKGSLSSLKHLYIGFCPSFATAPASSVSGGRAVFILYGDVSSLIGYTGGAVSLEDLPLGRKLESGDLVTVRLDRKDNSSNINVVRFYVNGQLQYETENIPTGDVYAAIAFYTNTQLTTPQEYCVDYLNVKYVP